MIHLDETTAECLVFTRKEGLLSAVAHDLKIRVGRFRVDVDDAARTAEGRFDAASLQVLCARSGEADAEDALSEAQKHEIEANIVRYVLDAKRHPEIRWASTSVEEEADGFRVPGILSLHGEQKPVTVAVRREADRWVATAAIHQPAFGIRPYSALLGALKVQADVEVRVLVPWPREREPG